MAGIGLSVVRLVAWGMLALAGILLLSMLWRVVLVVWRRFQPLNVWARYAEESSPYRRRSGRGGPFLRTVLVLLFILVLGAGGGGLLFLERGMQAYTPFTPDEVVARVQCPPAAEEGGEVLACEATLTGTGWYTTTVRGARWVIEGETVIWDPLLERLGLRSGYRLLRLVTYDEAGHVVAQTALHPAAGGLGRFVGWLDQRFPFVQAQQEIASGEVAAEMLYELIVSRRGFYLRSWEPTQP